MLAKRSCLAMALWGTGLLAGVPGRATAGEQVLLLLGVVRGDSPDPALRRSLRAHLEHGGEQLGTGSLSPADQRCDSQHCVEQLAAQHGATLVLLARVQENANHDYYLTLALFDRARRIPLYDESPCEGCTPAQLASRLSTQADRLLATHRSQPAAPPIQAGFMSPVRAPGVSALPSLAAARSAGALPGMRQRAGQDAASFHPQQILLAGGIGLLGIGLLSLSIGLSVKSKELIMQEMQDVSMMSSVH